ncbi:DUF2790 domain-containing protein [Pseudomonas abieticivorans]|uniref:DUF2790 domain-containing protein n=1 Tax=Pseudomonas abieticivorans TaxID=2931382 RepID=UPI0020BE8DDC|nr:DUF2790 domain-containing protein [Pseudomonas sp. PIA16]
MKSLIALALMGVSTFAAAASVESSNKSAVQEYTYSTHLDIAKVIDMSTVPNVCEVVPATMTYEDHQGQRHTIEYKVMGNGCSQS